VELHEEDRVARRCVLGAVGDIGLHGDVAEQIRRHGPAWAMGAMVDVLRRADVLFGNLEGVVLPRGFPSGGIHPGPLVTDIDVPAVLNAVPFHFVNLANNHVLDAGEEGMFHTRELLESSGIVTGGVGSSQADARTLRVVERNGLRLGFLCYAEDSNYTLSTSGACHAFSEPEAILEDVRSNRDEVDALIVSIHGDLEFMPAPSTTRLAVSRRIAEAGARVVLQHHPHVPQGVELWRGSLIAYSLGNFCCPVFTLPYLVRRLPDTAISQVLLIELDGSRVVGFQRVPCEIARPPSQRPVPVEGPRRAEIEAFLLERDRLLSNGAAVQAGWGEAALARFDRLRRELGGVEDPDAALTLLAKHLFVAENRNWMDEVYRLASERWDELRVTGSRYQPPSDLLFPRRNAPVSWVDRGIATLERIVARLKRARRRPPLSR